MLGNPLEKMPKVRDCRINVLLRSEQPAQPKGFQREKPPQRLPVGPKHCVLLIIQRLMSLEQICILPYYSPPSRTKKGTEG